MFTSSWSISVDCSYSEIEFFPNCFPKELDFVDSLLRFLLPGLHMEARSARIRRNIWGWKGEAIGSNFLLVTVSIVCSSAPRIKLAQKGVKNYELTWRTAKHRSSSSAFGAQSPRREASEHQIANVSWATACALAEGRAYLHSFPIH
mgnify:FL=1